MVACAMVLQKVSIVDTYKELMSKGVGNVLQFSTRGYVDSRRGSGSCDLSDRRCLTSLSVRIGPCVVSLVARVAHVGLTTVMMKTVSSAIYDLLLR